MTVVLLDQERAASRITACSLGKMPTTSVRRHPAADAIGRRL
jgi:hypothetical protein